MGNMAPDSIPSIFSRNQLHAGAFLLLHSWEFQVLGFVFLPSVYFYIVSCGQDTSLHGQDRGKGGR